MAIDDTPLAIDDREKTIAFDLFQRLKDIEEQYTGERIVGDPSSLTPDSSDKQPAIKVADATTEMDQAPDSFLRPRRYDIIEAKELPAPLPPDVSRMEFDMKDKNIRLSIENTEKAVDDLKDRLIRIEDKLDRR